MGEDKLRGMPVKPSRRAPALAAFLTEKRGGRSFKQVSLQLRAVGVTVSHNAIHTYESKARIPPLDVMWGLATLYRTSFKELVRLGLSGRSADLDELPEPEPVDELAEMVHELPDEDRAILHPVIDRISRAGSRDAGRAPSARTFRPVLPARARQNRR